MKGVGDRGEQSQAAEAMAGKECANANGRSLQALQAGKLGQIPGEESLLEPQRPRCG